MSEIVSLNIEELVATVRINRAKALNALNFEVLEGLEEAFGKLQALCQGDRKYSECRAVVLRSAGEKAFVAGADIKVMHGASQEKISRFIASGQQLMRRIELTPLPVIAVVQGFALGGGLELALACDMILASEQARFGQPEVSLGLIPGFGGTQRLAARVGIGTAKRLVYLGETITCREAKDLGIIDWMVPEDQLENKLAEITLALVEKSPLALASAKRAIEKFYSPHKSAGLSFEEEEFLELFSSEDAKEGLTAFTEKRKPQFQGR